MYILRAFINLILFIIIEYDDYSSNMKTHLKYIFYLHVSAQIQVVLS